MKDTTDISERLPASFLFALRDTRIEYAGVLRCCLGTVAEEYEGKNGEPDQKVSIGMKSRCRHCAQPFTLIEGVPYPRWTPDWQVGGANAENQATASAGHRQHDTIMIDPKPLTNPFHIALEGAGHKLVRDADGEVDDWQLDVDDPESFGGHNGPRCSLCDEVWCVYCEPKPEKCQGSNERGLATAPQRPDLD